MGSARMDTLVFETVRHQLGFPAKSEACVVEVLMKEGPPF